MTPLTEALAGEARAAYVDAAALALELPIAPAYRSGVLRYFAIAAEQAGLLMAVPLGTADEPAETFRPIGPGDAR